MLLSAAAVRPAAPQRLTLALTRYQTHVTDSPPAQRRTYRDSRNNMRSKPRCLSSAARSQLKRKDAFFSQKIAMRGVRYASTSAASSQTSPPSSIPSDPRQSSLTWQQFFDLRRSRRRYNVSSSVISAGGSTYLGMVLLQSNALDILSTMFGLDPFVSMGLTVTAAGGAGWLLGPVAGSTVFRLANSKVMRDMEAKETDFYARVKRHRSADASNQSLSNPVPDYYGEKISSVSDYRKWLKDQRAFTKKRANVL